MIYTFVLLAGLVSCTKPEVPQTEEPAQKAEALTLTVQLPKVGTYTYWQEGDIISAGKTNLSTPLSKEEAGEITATFEFEKPLSDGDLVRFPTASDSDSFTIPATQVSNSGLYDQNIAPLLGKVSLSDQTGLSEALTLKNSMAFFHLAISGQGSLTGALLTSIGGEPLNGNFKITADGQLEPVSNTTSTTTISIDSPINLNPEELASIYIPLPPGAYQQGVKLILSDSNGREMTLFLMELPNQLAAEDVLRFEFEYKPDAVEVIQPLPSLEGVESGDLSVIEPDPDSFFVSGTVLYDDGTPASGVKVTDGFTVALTDDKGQYTFQTAGYDVRYIYLSLPADAAIGKNSFGCPDFYKKYFTHIDTYDFTLTRQAVETEFMFFALSDAQAHHAIRSTQTQPDTERFISESVPAINSEIAKQQLPCYGIHLGDVIYSEGNRDSSPALTAMRSHFRQIDMPVFNVMGNHDYTFFSNDEAISTNFSSTSINLLSQRSFEDVFGPINYSFDRGNVHFVCMKDVYYNCETNWQWDEYTGGFTEQQYQWLVQDLTATPKDKMVVLCIHVPISYSRRGSRVQDACALLKEFETSVIFSGDAHYQRGVENTAGTGIFEKIHATICGQWWWSNIQGDGCPNGYTVYKFDGNDIKDSYLIGVNEGMNTRDYQMRIYKGNLCTGGKYAYFQMPYQETDYLINVFNGDPRWTVKVYEDGVYAGEAVLQERSYRDTFDPITSGETYTIPDNSTKDWWAIGYHIGYCQRGMTGTSYYTVNYHMWKWEASSPSAKISVEAHDPYGNVYTCDDIISDGLNYPDYIKTPLTIF